MFLSEIETFFIRDYDEGIVTNADLKTAESLASSIEVIKGFEEGFQGVVENRYGRYGVGIYDRNLIKVGWVFEA